MVTRRGCALTFSVIVVGLCFLDIHFLLVVLDGTLPFGRVWRETFEHSGYSFFQILFIFLSFIREHIFSAAAPYELLCFSGSIAEFVGK
jgi:hypothetical protein